MEKATKCAICDELGNSKRILRATFSLEDFNASTFSARRIPDRRHYQWVKCKDCGLLRSDPILDVDLKKLYAESGFDYSNEIHGLKNSYRSIVERIAPKAKGLRLVEVGGGNGFFLEEALRMGFGSVIEIEPSLKAKAEAPQELKQYFVSNTLEKDVLPEHSADVIAAFHVLDHLPHPDESLRVMNSILVPGGWICLAVHNANSISAKLLKSFSPIFDVEHTYLFTKQTMKAILVKAGYSEISVRHYRNQYSLAYLIQLVPIPRRIKEAILSSKVVPLLRKIRLSIPLGNIYAIARKQIS